MVRCSLTVRVKLIHSSEMTIVRACMFNCVVCGTGSLLSGRSIVRRANDHDMVRLHSPMLCFESVAFH